MKKLKTVSLNILCYAIYFLYLAIANFVILFILGIWNYNDKVDRKIDVIISDELDSLSLTLNEQDTNKCVDEILNFISYDISHIQSVKKYSPRYDYYEIEIELKCDKGIYLNGYTRKRIYESMFETQYFYTKRINKSDVNLTLFDILFLK